MWGPLIPAKMKGKSTEEQKKAREKFLACMFLASVDRKFYKKLIDNLNNGFLAGTNKYPEDASSMLAYLSNRTGDCNQDYKSINEDDDNSDKDAVSFMQTSQGQRKKNSAIREDDTAGQSEPLTDETVGWAG